MADYFNLLLFIMVMVGTPGPANMLLMTAGSKFGFSAAIPFIVGVTGGKFLLNLLLVFGLYHWLEKEPLLLEGLKFVSAGYMIWLSLGMMRGQQEAKTEETARPPGIVAGLIVHPLNPKAWAMVTIALADFGPLMPDPISRFLVIAGSFMMVQIVFHSLWCYGGSQLMRLISADRARITFQRILAILTVLLVLWIVLT